MHDQIMSERRSNWRDQIALYAFHSFLEKVQMNAGFPPCAMYIITRKLGLLAPLVTRKLLLIM